MAKLACQITVEYERVMLQQHFGSGARKDRAVVGGTSTSLGTIPMALA